MGYLSLPQGVSEASLADAALEVEVAWKRYPVKAQLKPWYDPQGARIKA